MSSELGKARKAYEHWGDIAMEQDPRACTDYIEALEAALRAAVPEGEPVAVKPLEWFERAGGFVIAKPEYWRDGYTIIVTGSRVTWQFDTEMEWREADNLEAAKAAAQADYEQRIRSALVSAPRPDMDRELAEARAEIERINSLYGFEQRGRLTAEARADALAAGKARLEGALREISSFLGENFARESIGRVVGDIARAALSGASIPAPADKAEARREALEEAAKVADSQFDADHQIWLDSAMSDAPAGARSFAAGEIATAIRTLISKEKP